MPHNEQTAFCFMHVRVHLQLVAARAQIKISYSLFN